MTTSVVANRIYQRGRITPEDCQELAPDTMLVRGLKPPTKSDTGVITDVSGASSDVKDDHPVRACVCFEVVKLPRETSKGNPLDLVPGDVVVAFNSVVDPLLGNDLAIMDINGVQFVAERAKRVET
jgi:hypothetical protein